MAYKRKSHKRSYALEILKRVFRPFISIAILTTFVLGITFVVKEMANTGPVPLLKMARPVLAKLNINVDEEKVGEVAGQFVERLSNTNLGGGVSSSREDVRGTNDISDNSVETGDVSENSLPTGDISFSIALLADAHSNFDNLESALNKVKENDINTVFFLGDYTELGLLSDLYKAKEIMDTSGLSYLSIPGDHDLWKTVGPENFLTVFEKNNVVKKVSDYKFVLLDNSANYSVIDEKTMEWFKKEVIDADFVVISQPLWHPFGGRSMGLIGNEVQDDVKAQAEELLSVTRNSESVKAIISADLHLSSENTDLEKADLTHIVIGALTEENNLQTPRFSILDVYESGEFVVRDVVL